MCKNSTKVNTIFDNHQSVDCYCIEWNYSTLSISMGNFIHNYANNKTKQTKTKYRIIQSHSFDLTVNFLIILVPSKKKIQMSTEGGISSQHKCQVNVWRSHWAILALQHHFDCETLNRRICLFARSLYASIARYQLRRMSAYECVRACFYL